MSLEGVCCAAKNVREVTRDWEEWELLVPGLMIGEKNGVPIFEDVWVSIESIWTWTVEGKVNFTMRDGPGWIGYPEDAAVRVREGA